VFNVDPEKSMNIEDPVDRAFRAYARQCERENAIYQQPAHYSGIRQHGGRRYVVLENMHGVLAVYRVMPSGRIRQLDDWPAALASG
jgi:hypothetical protein